MKIAFWLLIIIVLTYACQNPTDNGLRIKSPRKMTWTVDTLRASDNFQNLLEDVWGSSPNDVWATGWNPHQEILHYDGEKWNYINLGRIFVSPMYISRVYGFSETDVWFGGVESYRLPNYEYVDTAVIVHYNGIDWKRVPIEGRMDAGDNIFNIWGSDPDDVWFGGYNGELYHWDGSKIRRVALPIEIKNAPDKFGLLVCAAGNRRDNVYVTMQNLDTDVFPFLTHMFHYDGAQWTEPIEPRYGLLGPIWMSPEGSLYTSGIRKYNGTDFDFVINGGAIYGTSDKNLIVLHSNEIYHYNGVDWALIYQTPNPNWFCTDVWMDHNEVFVVAQTYENVSVSYAIHGK